MEGLHGSFAYHIRNTGCFRIWAERYGSDYPFHGRFLIYLTPWAEIRAEVWFVR